MCVSRKHDLGALNTLHRVEIWDIIDFRELPDAKILMCTGQFNAARSATDTVHSIDEPLLIYRASTTPELLFVYAGGSTDTQDNIDCDRLVRELIQRLAARGETPGSLHVVRVARPIIPVFLSDDEAIRSLAPDLQTFLQANNLQEMLDVAAEHPTLLSAAGMQSLALLQSTPPDDMNPEEWAGYLEPYHATLLDLREGVGNCDPSLYARLQAAQASLSSYEATFQWDELENAAKHVSVLTETSVERAGSADFRFDALHLSARVTLARFARIGEQSDLQQAESLLEAARSHAGNDAAKVASLLDSLATGLADRHEQSSDLTMLRNALLYAEKAVEILPSNSLDRPRYLNHLSTRLSEWSKYGGGLDYLNKAILVLEEAISLTPMASPERATCLTNLANRRSEQFWFSHDVGDIEASVAAAEQAVSATAEDHPALPLRLHNLSNARSDRYDRLGKLSDLNEALKEIRKALLLTDDEHPHRTAMLHNLGTLLMQKFRRLGDIKQLKAAIEATQRAVDVTPISNRHFPTILTALANAKSEYFGQSGDITYVDSAIEDIDKAIFNTKEGDINRYNRMNTLSNLRFERFKRWREKADLDLAINSDEEALKLANHPERAAFLNNLATMRAYQFKFHAGAHFLDAAIVAAENAVALTPKDHPDRPIYLNTAANRYLERYFLLKQPGDLGATLTKAEEAEAISRGGSASRPAYLNNLAIGYSHRYYVSGQIEDLEAALESSRQAIALAPEGHLERPMYLNNLATFLSARFDRLGQAADLQTAIDVARQAIAQLQMLASAEPYLSRLAGQANEYTRTLTALLWRADRHNELAAAIENGRGVRLRADLIRANTIPRGLDRTASSRYRDIVNSERLHRVEAARLRASIHNAQILAERLSAEFKEGVASAEVIETARSQADDEKDRLSVELVRQRNFLSKLRDERKALEINDPNFDPSAPSFEDLHNIASKSNDTLVYFYPLNNNLGTLWQIIAPISESSVAPPCNQQMAAQCTLERLHTLLFSSPDGGDDRSGQPVGWLTSYSHWLGLRRGDGGLAAYEAAAATWQSSMDHVLAALGSELLAPVADRLQALGAKRVVLIPGGLLGFLPLHAAKIDDETTFGDLFEVRYAASATLLKRAYEHLAKAPSGTPRLTAIVDPDRTLPFADGQVRAVASFFPQGTTHVAAGTKARKDWLLQHAPEADFLELATHASFDLDQSVQSAFQLAYPDGYYEDSLRGVDNGRRFESLTLGDIWSGLLALKPGCVVNASACETGLIDLKPDALEEQLGFPTAFLSAGAATVMASFWSVNDFSTWLLMANVYERMLVREENAASALHNASKDLRGMTTEQVIARLDPERCAIKAIRQQAEMDENDESYIAGSRALIQLREQRKRLNRLPLTARPFNHPFYWAAFGVHGAV